MIFEVLMPQLGQHDTTVEVVRWLAKVGQKVDQRSPVLEVKWNKSTVEIYSNEVGVLFEQNTQPDDNLSVGQLIARVDTDATPTIFSWEQRLRTTFLKYRNRLFSKRN